MTTKVEATASSVVVWCEQCAEWRELASSRQEGRLIAKRHESAVHPGATRAATRERVHRFRDTPKKSSAA